MLLIMAYLRKIVYKILKLQTLMWQHFVCDDLFLKRRINKMMLTCKSCTIAVHDCHFVSTWIFPHNFFHVFTAFSVFPLLLLPFPWFENFSYDCAINIEDLIKLSDVMNEHSLGPNGGQWLISRASIQLPRLRFSSCLHMLFRVIDWRVC